MPEINLSQTGELLGVSYLQAYFQYFCSICGECYLPTTITRAIKVRNLDERSSYHPKYLDGILESYGGQINLTQRYRDVKCWMYKAVTTAIVKLILVVVMWWPTAVFSDSLFWMVYCRSTSGCCFWKDCQICFIHSVWVIQISN